MDINKIQIERKNNKPLRSMKGNSHPGDLHNSYREGKKERRGEVPSAALLTKWPQ